MGKLQTIILIILGILFALSIPLDNSDHFENIRFDTHNLRNSKTSPKISINGVSGWASAKSTGICSGSGTYSDPYIIEDLVIDGEGSGTCIWIQNSDVYFKIENCTSYNSGSGTYYSGIKLSSVSNGIIFNNTVNNNDHGIFLENSNNNVIKRNTAIDNYWDGIFLLSNSNFNNISENSINGHFGSGIGSYYSDSNNISENVVENTGWGISLEFSHHNTISGNTAKNNDNFGIQIKGGFDNTISGNSVSYNSDGIKLESWSYDNMIWGNNATYNSVGTYLEESNDNDIRGNIINLNNRGAILEESNNNIFSDNDLNHNLNRGLFLYHSDSNTVSGNTINNNNKGIRLEVSDGNDVLGNTLSNNYVGIEIIQSKCNDISNNTFNENDNDIIGTQDACIPAIDPNLIRTVLLSVMIIVPIILIVGMSRMKKKPFPLKFAPSEKNIKKDQIITKPIRKTSFESERESEIPTRHDSEITDKISIEEKITEEEDVTESIPEEHPEEIHPPEPQIRNCPFCGIEITEGMAFCPQCGATIRKK